ncbi:MAG: DUF2177 family protein [Gemmatimonadaceae bacterium]
MPMLQFLKLYAAAAAVFFALDIAWLGYVARGIYKEQMGHLTRADVQWVPAVLFYLVYVAAIIVLCVKPGLQRDSVGHAVALGALFGLAAYAAFDLTGLALLKDFPLKGALVDLAWGTLVTATVSGTSVVIGRWLQTA